MTQSGSLCSSLSVSAEMSTAEEAACLGRIREDQANFLQRRQRYIDVVLSEQEDLDGSHI